MGRLVNLLLAVSAIFVLSSRAKGLERLTIDEVQDQDVKKQAIIHTTKGDLYLDIVNYLCMGDNGKLAWETYLIAMWDGRFSNKPLNVGEELAQVSYLANESQYAIEVPRCRGAHSVCPGDLLPGGAIIQVPGETGRRSGVSRCRMMIARTYQEVGHYELAVHTDGFEEHNAAVVRSLVDGDSIRGIEIGKAQTQITTASTNSSGTSNSTSQQEQKIYPMHTWAPYKGLEFMVTDAGGVLTDNYELARAYRVDKGMSRREYEEKYGNMNRDFDAVRLRIRSATPGTRHVDFLNIASLGNGSATAFTGGFVEPPLEAYYYLLNGHDSPHEFDVGYNTYVERVIPFPGQSGSVMYLNLDNSGGMGGANIECGRFWEFRKGEGKLRIIPVQLLQR